LHWNAHSFDGIPIYAVWLAYLAQSQC
jgi:hypothetical protein